MTKRFTLFILYYLRFFAKISLYIHKPFVLGIAGSAGKSSTKYALYAILKDYFKTKMLEGNSETGIPLGILGLPTHNYSLTDWLLVMLKAPFVLFHIRNTQYLIVEMGIDEPFPPKNMEYLLTIVKPKMTINLNVSGTHTEQFEKLLPKEKMNEDEQLAFLVRKIAEEDVKIATQSGANVCIYNNDDTNLKTLLENFSQKTSVKTKTFGKEQNNSIWYKSYSISLEGSDFSFSTTDGEIVLHFPNVILPEVYREVFAADILLAIELGLSPVQIKLSLEKNFALPKGRSSLLKGMNNSTIIDSSYNSSKNSVVSFLQTISLLKKKIEKPVIFLCGDMNELGSEAKFEHEYIAEKIIGSIDYLYCVGKLTKKYIIPYLESHSHSIKEIQWFPNSVELGKFLENKKIENSIVLVKGSQNGVYLEEAIKFILADKDDSKKLCRQDSFWMSKKNSYFKGL